MTPEQADLYALRTAAYVHIPFCHRVCPYCDFAVVAGRDDMIERYRAAVVAEIAADDRWRPLDAVYFGGGTPSHVPSHVIGSILETLESRHGLAPDAELSIEANPEDFTEDHASALHRLGLNRVSFGAQSFDDVVLNELGRHHEAPRIGMAVSAAREAGFDNLSVDLIYGSPLETDESWEGSLQAAIQLEVEHVSAYALTVERGTPLGRSVAGGAPGPDPDIQADRYETADRVLSAASYGRYEISNWSRPGRQCRYNLTVWAQGEYLAYGNGAHGYRDGRRYRNHRRLDAYMSAVETGRSPRSGEDVVTGWDAELDRLFVGLRRVVGVATGPGTEALIASGDGERLLDAGVIAGDENRLRIKRPLLSDAVNRSVMALEGPIVGGHGDA